MTSSMLASCVAAAVTAAVTHPIDTIKSRLQTGIGIAAFHSSLIATLLHVVQNEGVFALYHGFFITLVLSLPALTMYLVGYDMAVPWIAQWVGCPPGGFLVSTLAATFAQILSALLWTPMEVLKIRQQIASPMVRTEPVADEERCAAHAASDLVNEETPLLGVDHISVDVVGPSGLGHDASDNNNNKTVGGNEDDQQGQQSLDCHQCNRLRISSLHRRVMYASAWYHIQSIYAEKGILGFFQGYWLGLAVFIPYSIVYFVVYEQLKAALATMVVVCTATAAAMVDPDCNNTKDGFELAIPGTRDACRLYIGDTQHRRIIGIYDFMLCAACAAGIAAFVSNAVDVLKTRWQAQSYLPRTPSTASITSEPTTTTTTNIAVTLTDLSTASPPTSPPILETPVPLSSTLMNSIRSMMRRDGGILTFTRGAAARVAWAVPNAVISFTLYETLK